MKIAVIGPLPPYRSGIARHTAALADALAAHGAVERWSFARQYPRFLFPGESDRDEKARPVAGGEYILDAINPLNWKAVAKKILAGKPDIAVIPAWTFFVAPSFAALTSALRRGGVRVISVVHNAADHEGAPWKQWLLQRQIAQADAVVTHTQALADTVRAFAPSMPIEIAPHPLFEFPAPRSKLPRRAPLELLMFGLVRPYKGADLLIDAVAQCTDIDLSLSIVGEIWEGEDALRAQIKKQGVETRVELLNRFVSDDEAAGFFDRADIVVLPYRSVTGSGVAPVAWGYGKPVIATDLPGFREVVEDGVNGWLAAPKAGALAGALRARAIEKDAQSLSEGIKATQERLSWPAFASAVMYASSGNKSEVRETTARPKVTVLMAVYNGGAHLREAIDSVLAQDFDDYEFLIVNDGSTDSTAAILADYTKHHNQIRVITNRENLGVATCANIGFDAARGDYVARLDADDICAPQRLARQAAFLDDNPDHSLVAGGCEFIDESGSVTRTDAAAVEPWDCAWRSIFILPFIHSSLMFRADARRRHEIDFDTRFVTSSDFHFTQRLLRHGNGAVLPGVFVKYRMHDANLSTQKEAQQRENAFIASCEEATHRFPEIPAAQINAAFSFLRLHTPLSDGLLDDAFRGLKEIEEAHAHAWSLDASQRKRQRALIARWIFAAVRRRRMTADLRLFASFLWRARDYWREAPGEAAQYVKRRLPSRNHENWSAANG